MDSALPVNKRHEYREEAQSIRAIASEMKNPQVQEQLLLIASLYDKLADIAEHAGLVPTWAGGRRKMAGQMQAQHNDVPTLIPAKEFAALPPHRRNPT
jgi:hypothetical protein